VLLLHAASLQADNSSTAAALLATHVVVSGHDALQDAWQEATHLPALPLLLLLPGMPLGKQQLLPLLLLEMQLGPAHCHAAVA
jgi:hypothetical protein